ncbi:MAG TPA: fasciclin domain-containing protein [Allosphingosinicella sp.]|nr:fasciclin domain-containing protein [Allosphingosinicella sp.]
MSLSRSLFLAAALLAAPVAATAGSSASMASGSVVDVAVASPQHTTLVAAVQAAGLAETLSGAGPFTVFAPVDSAFRTLPAGAVETLLRPENRGQLQGLLTYHVVPGRVTAGDLVGLIRQGGGAARITTVQGGALTARLDGSNVVLTDARGGTAKVVVADIAASNGIVHATDAVSMPR